jgi:hypothetical protein
MRPPTPTPSPPSSTASASSAPDAALPADLAPDSAGPTGHCLVGTKPWNIEFYGADAANTCAKYSNEFADMGFPNQPVHAYAPPGDPNFVELRPSGASIGCGLQWPLDINRLQATVFGYNGGDITSDAGPIAKAICAKMIGLGWQH